MILVAAKLLHSCLVCAVSLHWHWGRYRSDSPSFSASSAPRRLLSIRYCTLFLWFNRAHTFSPSGYTLLSSFRPHIACLESGLWRLLRVSAALSVCLWLMCSLLHRCLWRFCSAASVAPWFVDHHSRCRCRFNSIQAAVLVLNMPEETSHKHLDDRLGSLSE